MIGAGGVGEEGDRASTRKENAILNPCPEYSRNKRSGSVQAKRFFVYGFVNGKSSLLLDTGEPKTIVRSDV